MCVDKHQRFHPGRHALMASQVKIPKGDKIIQNMAKL